MMFISLYRKQKAEYYNHEYKIISLWSITFELGKIYKYIWVKLQEIKKRKSQEVIIYMYFLQLNF